MPAMVKGSSPGHKIVIFDVGLSRFRKDRPSSEF
jgi:hypothetical protein